MRKLIILLILSFTVLNAGAVDHRMALDAMNRLDDGLARREAYISLRQSRIDSLRTLLESTPDDLVLLMQAGDLYTGFNNDSALVYFDRGLKAATDVNQIPFKLKLASVLPLGGFFSEATELFYGIDTTAVPAALKEQYFSAGRQMHSYIAAFFNKYNFKSMPHRLAEVSFQEKLLEVIPEDSPDYDFTLGEYYFTTGSIDKAEIILEEVVNSKSSPNNIRARAANHLASIADARDDSDAKLYYLAVSALADTESATREILSLQELGAAVYDTGDIARSYNYLSKALENAVECGAPLRMVDTSKSLNFIEQAHSASIDSWRRTIYWIMAAMALLMLGLGAALLILRHEMHKMAALQASLSAANDAKEVYISQFLQLCSIYMDKLNQFCKVATRKLASGQGDELYHMIRSGKFIEDQSRDFYEVFDNAFLHIYPDFIERVNELLRPDQRITVENGLQLNTDLRILAFMRLGIEESSRIAQILNYSLNTIYSYRNRLKARAINRDTFEADIMKIQ